MAMSRNITNTNPRRQAGLSLVEALVALAIIASLLTAITVALNASFHAYATASETASTQTGSRMVMHRLIGMIRTARLHDAYDPGDGSVTLALPSQPPVQSVGVQMIDPAGQLLKIWWAVNAPYGDADLGDLWYQIDSSQSAPLLERVRIQRTGQGDPYVFTLASRSEDGGLLLSRATVDLTVEPGADATLALETVKSRSNAVRLVASTVPRRNIE